MPDSLQTNSATMLDWLAVSKHMGISLTLNCEPIQPVQFSQMSALDHRDEPIVGSHIREAAATVKKLFTR